MIRSRAATATALGALFTLSAVIACAGDGGTAPPAAGTISVSAATTGEDIDADGYTVDVNGDARPLGVNASTVFGELDPGAYGVELTGVAPNCTVADQNPRTVTVTAGDTAETTFDVACVRLAGDLEVTISTTGEDVDPDGYAVGVEGETQAAGADDVVTFAGLAPGELSVELTGVRANCSVAGENPRTVAVTVNATSTASFEVTCLDAVVNQIAFYSDRGGQEQIYVQNAGGPAITRLTDESVNIHPAISPDGTKIVFLSGRDSPAGIYVMNADGSDVTRLTTTAGTVSFPTWSPDGSRIVYQKTVEDGTWEIFVMNADGSDPVNLTNDPAHDFRPHWSPDGSRIAFTSDRDGNRDVFVMNADGTNPVNVTNDSDRDEIPRWSPDGSRIAFASNRDGNFEVYLMDPDGRNLERLTDHPELDYSPSWSPDGSRIAFLSERDGNFEIYIMDADGTDPVNLTDNPARDLFPWWSPIE